MSTILTALAVLAAAAPGLLVSPADLAAALKDPATVVIAVGNSEDDFIAGHIPGARFVRYDDIAIDAGGLSSELPPVEQLRKVLSAAGMRASVTYFVARHLGYDARLYDGSIVDWTRRKLPAVMGK
jgi:3-mercaptopyruvate sulfurtransferase SseA